MNAARRIGAAIIAVSLLAGCASRPATPPDTDKAGHAAETIPATAQAARSTALTPKPVVAAPPARRAKPAPASGRAALPAGAEKAFVVCVYDGDTITVNVGGHREKVRLIGIDTPEKGRPFDPEATAATKRLVLGKSVGILKDISDRDMYGRLLRYVYIGSVMVNAELVRGGYAMAYTYPPDVSHAELFARLQAEARKAKRGLWGLPEDEADVRTGFVASRISEKYHKASCRFGKRISTKNLITFRTRAEAEATGRTPCRRCGR